MADIFGRHNSLQAVLVLMIIGSALCTGAPTSAYPVLLLGRGFQGVACAGISVLVRTIISDKVSLQENAKNWSFFAITGGCSYAIGPVIGGYLTSANWRWCFAINLPICVLGIIIVFVILRKELVGPQPLADVDNDGMTTATTTTTTTRSKNTGSTILRRLMTIDIGGQLLFLFGFGLIILAFTWAGETYAWNSYEVLLPLVLGILIVVAWTGYEYLMSPERALGKRFSSQKPMIPFQFLKNRNVGLLFYINFSTGAAIYSVRISANTQLMQCTDFSCQVLYYVDLYYTLILGYSYSKAGTQLLYYVPGISIGVYSAVLFSNVWPRGTFFPLFLGSVIEAVGVGMIAWAMSTGHVASVYGMVAFSGVGTGLRFMPGTLHAVGFFPNDIASIVSLMGIASPFGGAVALTVMSTVYNNLANKDAEMAFVWAFVAMCPLMGMCIVCAACLGNVSIIKPGAGEEGDCEAKHIATNESYLLGLLRARKAKPSRDVMGGQEQGEAGVMAKEKGSDEMAISAT